MGKAAWEAPLYLSVAWTLMISYQMFTQTAIITLVSYVNMFWPFVLMVIIDLRARKRRRKEKALENVSDIYVQDAIAAEQKSATMSQS